MVAKFRVVDKKTGKRISFIHFVTQDFYNEETLSVFLESVRSEINKLSNK